MYTDTHAHLDDECFDTDRGEVIQRAKDAGLGLLINIGVDQQSAEASLRLARQHPGFMHVAVGIHPNYSSDFDDARLRAIKRFAREPEVLAIGEIGLDYYRDHATPDQQRRALFAQLELADSLNLPVIIHERAAAQELVPLLIAWQQALPPDSPIKQHPGVMHAFGAPPEFLFPLLEAGFYFGIGGPVTYKNAQDKQTLVQNLPLERILLETDCPYLTPHPHRGERNEPSYIPFIAEKIAALKGITPQEVVEQTAKNAFRLFGLESD